VEPISDEMFDGLMIPTHINTNSKYIVNLVWLFESTMDLAILEVALYSVMTLHSTTSEENSRIRSTLQRYPIRDSIIV
jgi:hypothetical protein